MLYDVFLSAGVAAAAGTGKSSGGTLAALVIYMLAIVGIGVYYARRANKSSEDYFIGGRTLGPWISALSAEASDMSGWLLMGLPGTAYWLGLAGVLDGGRTCDRTYLNWLIVAKRFAFIQSLPMILLRFRVISVTDLKRKPLLMSMRLFSFSSLPFMASCFVTIELFHIVWYIICSDGCYWLFSLSRTRSLAASLPSQSPILCRRS